MSRTVKAIAYLFVFIASLYLAKELLGNVGCKIKFTRSDLKTYNLSRILSRTQWLYHHFIVEIDDYNRFMQEELADISQLKYYQYDTEITNDAGFNWILETEPQINPCSKKVAPLLSLIFPKKKTPKYTLTGAIFFTPQSKNQDRDIVCKSIAPGWQTTNKPYLENNQPVCGEGTTKLIAN